jgi:hypothetical protein
MGQSTQQRFETQYNKILVDTTVSTFVLFALVAKLQVSTPFLGHLQAYNLILMLMPIVLNFINKS